MSCTLGHRIVATLGSACFWLALTAQPAAAQKARPVATVSVSGSGLSFAPLITGYEALVVTLTGPGAVVVRKEFAAGQKASVALGEGGQPWPDGQYRYELRVVPRVDAGAREALQAAREAEDAAPAPTAAPTGGESLVQSGAFQVRGGSIVPISGAPEPGGIAPQLLVAENLYVQGSACIGIDCVNGEGFGTDTIKLKENTLRIKFDDTSTSAGFPANDWQLTANDMPSGGVNKFSIDDITGARTPFTIEAGPTNGNAIYVDGSGRVGFRTATPVLDLHVNTSNTPALRLEQNNSGGFTAQTWDVGSNEANFFVRDVTGGSRLSFRIRPGAPTSSLDISADGDVGVGTGSPDAALHVFRANAAQAQILIEDASTAPLDRRLLDMQNNGGIRMRLRDNSTGTDWAYQNVNSDFRINANGGAEEFTLTTAGNLTILGTLSQNSDRNLKTAVKPVDPEDVLARLATVPISTWAYKAETDPAQHMGPMAQDFAAAFGLGADERRLAPGDMGGVALAAIQALHRKLERREAELTALQALNADLGARLAALESLLGNDRAQAVQPVPDGDRASGTHDAP
jgi:endosialidase-like protein